MELQTEVMTGVDMAQRQPAVQQRIGIDVGGTNTDAVLMQGREVVGWVKTPTTADVTSGIVTALQELLQHTAAVPSAICGVMIGTTHFTNAVVSAAISVQWQPCGWGCQPQRACRH